MTLIKRIFTSAIIFFPLFVILYFGICFAGGAVMGARSAMDHPNAANKTALGAEAGRDFVKNDMQMIIIGAVGAAALASLVVSFSGMLPWCRKPSKR